MIDLSIIIPHWNGRQLALDCLASIDREIRRRDDPGRIETETLFVDNGSEDDSVAAVREHFAWARVLALPHNVGFAAGCNAALPHARGRHLCILNNDTTVLRDSFETCVRYLDSHPDVGVVGPELLYPDGRAQNSIHRFPSLRIELSPWGTFGWPWLRRVLSKRSGPATPIDVDAVIGACMIARREVIEQVGGLPEDYFFFFEETDWLFRVRRGGWRVVYHPGAQLIHVLGATRKRVPISTRIEFHRSLYHFFRTYHGPRRTALLVAIRVIKLLLGTLAAAPPACFSAAYRERLRQRVSLLRWHAAGRPASSGLRGATATAQTESPPPP